MWGGRLLGVLIIVLFVLTIFGLLGLIFHEIDGWSAF